MGSRGLKLVQLIVGEFCTSGTMSGVFREILLFAGAPRPPSTSANIPSLVLRKSRGVPASYASIRFLLPMHTGTDSSHVHEQGLSPGWHWLKGGSLHKQHRVLTATRRTLHTRSIRVINVMLLSWAARSISAGSSPNGRCRLGINISAGAGRSPG